RILNCEFKEGTSAQPVDVVDITGSGANQCDRVKIQGCRFYFPTAGPATCVKIGAVHVGLELTDNWIQGDFSTAAVSSGSAFTDALIARNVISNVNAGDWAIELTAAATGMLVDNRLYADAPATVLDPGSMKCVGNRAVSAIDNVGYEVPAPLAYLEGLPRNYFSVTADFTSATWNTAASHEIATVTGAARLVILPQVTGAPTSAGSAATLVLGDETTSNSLIASTDAENLAVGEWWFDATDTRTVASRTIYEKLDFLVHNGKDIGYTIGTEALTGGSIKFNVFWEPLDATGHVAAGAGGAL
ncbi:MAG TPA: hypothetical protein VEI97_01560, partial [bacterium]|nr:hypothetical protein [bacterium]